MVTLEEALQLQWEAIDADPCYFSRDICGFEPWGAGDPWGTQGVGQRQVLEATRAHRRVLVTGSNGAGKTHLFSALALEFIARGPGRVMMLSGSEEQSEQTLMPKLAWMFGRVKDRALALADAKLMETAIRVDAEWDVQIVVTKTKSKFTGRHPDRLLILCDEAFALKDDIFFAIDTMMQAPGCRVVLALNPDKPECAAYRRAFKAPGWTVLPISALDHPNVRLGREIIPAGPTREWVEEMRRNYGEDSQEWSSAVLGRFPESILGLSKIITMEMLEKALLGEVAEASSEDVDMGVDLGRSANRDPSTVALVRAGVVEEIVKRRSADSMDTIGWIASLARDWGVPFERVHVDSIGIGGPVVDRMREQGMDVDAVNFAETAKGDWSELLGDTIKFGRRRSELYWVARMLLINKRLRVPARFQEAWAELTEGEIRYNSKGEVMVEDKDAIRSRLGRSPDSADAIVLALSRSNAALAKPFSFSFR